MTTMKITVKDDFTQQNVTIKYALGGPGIEYYIEAFRAALLVIGFDQKIVDERMPQEQ